MSNIGVVTRNEATIKEIYDKFFKQFPDVSVVNESTIGDVKVSLDSKQWKGRTKQHLTTRTQLVTEKLKDYLMSNEWYEKFRNICIVPITVTPKSISW